MTNELVVSERQSITPPVWQMLSEIAQSSSISQVERTKIIKKMLFCYENGLPLSVAVNGGLYVVGDRLEAEGTVIRAQIKKHPHYDYRIDALDNNGCAVTILWDDNEIGSVSFTSDDAKQAGLLGKAGPWQQYPSDMYLNRATSRAYKRFCPDIFFQSVYVRGEIGEDQSMIIEQDTVQSLTNKYGSTRVLDAMQQTGGDIDAMVEWLEANGNDNAS